MSKKLILFIGILVIAGIAWGVSAVNVVMKSSNNNGLVSYWSFNEGTGSTVYDPISNNNGTFSTYMATSTWVEGKRGTALNFDNEEGDVVTVATDSSLDVTTFSVEAWIKLNDNTVRHILMSKRNGTTAGWDIEHNGDSDGRFTLFVTNAGTWTILDADNHYVTDTNWHHLVVTYDNPTKTAAFYVDGESAGGESWATSLVAADASNLLIGSYPADYWNGMIDEVRFYDRVLSAAEAERNYQAGRVGKLRIATANPHDWSTGLVGHWDFNGKNTTSTEGTRDESDNGNWGAFNGGVKPTAGIVGQALSFDGVDDYVDVGSDASLCQTTNLTLELWVNFSKLSLNDSIGDEQDFFSNQKGTSGWTLYNQNNTDNFNSYWNTSIGGNWFVILTTAYVNTWYHIVVTYDGSNFRSYVNGIAGTPESWTATLTCTDPESLKIGTFGTPGHYFNGKIDEVRIYNRTLSAEEVVRHYQQSRRNLRL